MNSFWDIVFEPILKQEKAKTIVEVGAQYGADTQNLIAYAKENNAVIHSIDPIPRFDFKKLEEDYPEKFFMHIGLSLDCLEKIEASDVYFLDGDHNWYTVYHELCIISTICKESSPIIFLHDIGWPYGRRDMYYDPENIPKEYCHECERKGILIGKSELVENGLNYHLYNAVKEGGSQNGVLTAIEDFIKEHQEYQLIKLECMCGLAIVYKIGTHMEIQTLIDSKDVLLKVLQKTEEKRNIAMISVAEKKYHSENLEKKYRESKTDKKRLESNIIELKQENKEVLEKEREKYNESQKNVKNLENKISELKQKSKEELKKEVEKYNESQKNVKNLENKILELKQKNIIELKEQMEKYNESQVLIKELENKILDLIELRQKSVIEMGAQIKQYNESQTYIKELEANISQFNESKQRGIDKLKGQIKILSEQLTDEKRKATNYKNEYLKYKESIRYKFGTLIFEAMSSPIKIFLLPKNILKLYKTRNNKKLLALPESKVSNEESKVKVKVEDIGLKKYKYSMMKEELEQVWNEKISLILPVYNAAEELKKCLDSIIKWTYFPYQIFIIDDCSPDPSVQKVLNEYTEYKNIKVYRNESNLGFVKTVNKGIQMTFGDVVLINSDIIVSKNWLENLCIAAYSNDKIATVTPFSNAAGAFSVPNCGQNEDLPEDISLDYIADGIRKISKHIYTKVPTGNGFCMYIKRAAFEKAGILDEEAFGKGYGEENDFCMRLQKLGLKNIIADDTFVYHKRSVSFGEQKKDLLEEHRKILDQRYPDYKEQIKIFHQDKNLITFRNKIDDLLYTKKEKIRKRILYFLHEAGGGTVKTNEDLMSYASKEQYDVYMLNNDTKQMKLYQFKEGELHLLSQWKLQSKWEVKKIFNKEYEEIYFDVLKNLEIDIVHVRHIFKQSFDIFTLCKKLNIPTIISFHDFYFICPTINLINSSGIYCNAECRECDNSCKMPNKMIHFFPSNKWVEEVWRPNVREILKDCVSYITTSQYAQELYSKVYPEFTDRFYVIEHGRDFEYNREFMGEIPQEGKRIKILLAGNIGYNKGEEYIKKLIEIDKKNQLEFHCIGVIAEELKEKIIYHGKYARDDFNKYVKEIRPSYIGIFSIWPETYCHVLTEAWSCGIPCIISDIGTLRERGLKGGAILADLDMPQKTYESILDNSYNEEKYVKLYKGALEQKIRTISEMGSDYIQLYSELVSAK